MSSPGAPPKVKVSRLKTRADFLRLARGRKWAAPGLVLQMAPVEGDETRAGFTVTKKIGNAVVRNRAKRRLREVARAVLPLYASPGCDYVLIAREATPDRPFASLVEDLKQALRKVHGGRPPKAEEP
ncbi:MAG: ribonuclease P protein component [Alphaproteobacteria bacterium]|nr:ribonuclease P protein component [Alphaproteobacteria bacterium]